MSIKTKNILRNIGFLLSIPVLIGAFVFAISKDEGSVVRAIDVKISNANLGFVTSKDVQKSLFEENVILDQSVIAELDISALEDKINSNPWVETAEVFVNSSQSLEVKLTQVTPKLRVQETDSTGNGYYLDAHGSMIPLSRNFAADLPILTTERTLAGVEQRKELVDFAQFIEQDTFWHATISQINLDKKNDIELISLIGDANIRFGSTDNMEDKFSRLFQFYKKGINRINWSNVKELDLRFNNQLVCRRFHKENHIEERRAPIMYAKSKPDFVPSEPHAKSAVVKEQAASPIVDSKPNFDVPKRRKVVSKNVWKEDESAKSKTASTKSTLSKNKTSNKSTNKGVAKVIKKAPKKAVKKKIVAKKKTTTKKVVAKTEAKPKPKKKKQREIIINTEPVTKK